MGDTQDADLGATLKRLRTAAGMTQETLAERAGISARTVSDVERGLRTTVYADTARRLAGALALAPDEEHSFHALARGRGDVREAGRTVAVPTVPTRLLGRSVELDEIAVLVTQPETRLVTLTGPGGIGKTRLALEVARRVEPSFPAGVFFVSLGELGDPSLVATEVAKALGVVADRESLPRLIGESLAGRRALVVLDTFEHLIPAAPLVYAVMLGCADVTLLVTSRTAVRLRGEREFPVPPLALPPSNVERPEELVAWPATALFVERAKAVSPDLDLDAASVKLIMDICRNLDGLPLAIELAAARVKHLPLGAVREQLEHRLRLLVGGPLDLPRRQRTIRDTVGWSHDLLSQPERTLFRRLSVFSGGWTLAAADAVCGPLDEPGGTLESISALVDHSLVALDRRRAEGRYDMLEVVRDYAAERLVDAGERDEIARGHALYYLDLAEQAGPGLVRTGHKQWFARLDAERGNLRRALAWALERSDTILALRFTAALWRYWRQLGEFMEARRWSEAALAVPGEAPPSLRAKAVGGAAALAFPQADYARMAELAAELEGLAARSDDPLDLRNARTIHGMVAMGQGRYPDALAAFREALAICEPLGSTWQLATSHLNLGLALLHLGAFQQADTAFEEALEVYRRLGDDVFAARAVNHRAHAALMQGDTARAEGLARDSLAGFAEQNERQGVADALETLAAIAAHRSDMERAATLRGAVAAIRETIAARAAPFEAVISARFTDPLEQAADADRWEAAWTAGHAMTRDAAVGYALSGDRTDA